MKPASAIQRTCMRDRIRDELVKRILDGHYPAGTQLKELLLAREFNVSQAPIREALRELEGSGLVTSERYRGTRVRGADHREMRDSYELRATMEARAVELALPCTPATLARLDAHFADMRAALAVDDTERYIDAALALHRCLIEASGNQVFVTVWDSLHFEVRGRLVLRLMAAKGGGYQPLIDLHERLIDQLRNGDGPGAVATTRTLFERVSSAFG
ncbi:MAG: GntR family transcriptional regulator [Steroidobacteraceae bacterium]